MSKDYSDWNRTEFIATLFDAKIFPDKNKALLYANKVKKEIYTYSDIEDAYMYSLKNKSKYLELKINRNREYMQKWRAERKNKEEVEVDHG